MADDAELTDHARIQVERARAYAAANGHVIGRLLSARRQEINWRALADRMTAAHGDRARDMIAQASAQLARVRWLVLFEGPTPAGPEGTEAWYVVFEDSGEVEWRGNG
jgi:hypothetical protein